MFRVTYCLADQVRLLRDKKPSMTFSKMYISIATINFHGPNMPKLGLFKPIGLKKKKNLKRTSLTDSQAVNRWPFSSINLYLFSFCLDPKSRA